MYMYFSLIFACYCYSSARFNPKLRLTRCDRVVLRSSNVEFAIQRSVHDIENASTHDAVYAAVRCLTVYAVMSETGDVINSLKSAEWQQSLKRYAHVEVNIE